MWTRESLHKLVGEKFRDYLFVVVSNREPYVHSHALGEIHCDRPPSGLTTEPAFSLFCSPKTGPNQMLVLWDD